jgi:hypothetical protein
MISRTPAPVATWDANGDDKAGAEPLPGVSTRKGLPHSLHCNALSSFFAPQYPQSFIL